MGNHKEDETRSQVIQDFLGMLREEMRLIRSALTEYRYLHKRYQFLDDRGRIYAYQEVLLSLGKLYKEIKDGYDGS